MIIKEPLNVSDKLQQFCVSWIAIHTWRKFANAYKLSLWELELFTQFAIKIT